MMNPPTLPPTKSAKADLTPPQGGSVLLVLTLLMLGFILPHSAFAAPSAETPHAEITLRAEQDAIIAGQPLRVSFDMQMIPHWHIYWRNPGDSGIPTAARWDLPEGWEASEFDWPVPESFEMGGLVNYGYKDAVRLPVTLTPPAEIVDREVTLTTTVSWLICEKTCIPESAELSLTLPVKSTAKKDASFASTLQPVTPLAANNAHYTQTETEILLAVNAPDPATTATFFPYAIGAIDPAAPQNLNLAEDGRLVLTLRKGESAVSGEFDGVLALGDTAYSLQATPDASLSQLALKAPPATAPVLGFAAAIMLAFLGGALLNLMPCVFPVLSLKALAISRKTHHSPAQMRRQGVAYLLGVLASFALLAAVIIALKSSGEQLGWGFQLQSPIFVAVMLVIFFLLGLSLAGYFHLPVLFGVTSQQSERQDSTKGSFITGVLAVMVATPCAVPFMAPAIGYAFAQNSVVIMLIMLALGFGLALPYLLITFTPALRRFLPKPGAWMEGFKQLMAFFMFASSIWLLWVLAQQVSIDTIALVLFALLGFVFLIWFAANGSNARKIGSLAAAAIMSLALYPSLLPQMAPLSGITYASLKQPFSAARLAALRAEGKPVLVNATAAWCLTCKLNERIALRDTEVMNYLHKEGISYLVADWTNYDAEITSWLAQYQRAGVPLYVYYPAKAAPPVILPELLTPSIVMDALTKETL